MSKIKIGDIVKVADYASCYIYTDPSPQGWVCKEAFGKIGKVTSINPLGNCEVVYDHLGSPESQCIAPEFLTLVEDTDKIEEKTMTDEKRPATLEDFEWMARQMMQIRKEETNRDIYQKAIDTCNKNIDGINKAIAQKREKVQF